MRVQKSAVPLQQRLTGYGAALLIAPLLALAAPDAARADLLVLEGKIPLGEVSGRIDHMAVDLGRRRLIVAELGNDTVGIVDLAGAKLLHRIAGLKEPQGVAYVAEADLIYAANANDGAVHLFRAADFAPAGMAKLAGDADNIRVDPRTSEAIVGYGKGGLAVLDSATGRKTAEIPLPAHPESFQLDPRSKRVFVNLPDARHIGVVDRESGREIARWGVPEARGNFPMVLDADATRLFVVYRRPALIGIFDAATGTIVKQLPTCGDADDIFFDEQRKRIYVSCGDGELAIVQQDGGDYREVARLPTKSGARTALFVPELDRLFLAVRAGGGEGAAIWIYRPAP
jgi:DNA-binding beta-propeller fold protein YncE